MILFIFRAIFENEGKENVIVRPIRTIDSDKAWEIAIQELQKNNICARQIIEVGLITDGHKGVTIKEDNEKIDIFFDNEIELSLPKPIEILT